MKQIKLKKNIIKIVIIILIVLIVPIVRRFIILRNLERLATETRYINNFSFVSRSYSFDSSYYDSERILELVSRGYVKENSSLTVHTTERNGLLREMRFFFDDLNTIVLLEENGEVTLSYVNGVTNDDVGEMNVHVEIPTLIRKEEGWFSYLRHRSNFFSLRISRCEVNSIPAYLVELRDGTKYWIERQTGVILKSININPNDSEGTMVEFTYTINNVTDSDIVRPDI